MNAKKMTSKKIAVFVHLYYHDLWPEIHQYLQNLDHLDFKLFISLCSENSSLDAIEKKIYTLYPDAYIGKYSNKGLDVGPFLLLLKESYQDPVIYDYFIKIHTKKSLNTQAIFGDTVRKNLFKTLLGSRKKVNMIMKYLAWENIGMIWPKEYIGMDISNTKNTENIIDIKKILGCEQGYHCVFYTMFWSKYSIFQKYFTPHKIEILYEKMLTGWQQDQTPAHALERIFWHIVENENLEIMWIRSSNYGIIVHNLLFLFRGQYYIPTSRDSLVSMANKFLKTRAPKLHKILRAYIYGKK